jgi:hypothetical protein
MSAFNTRIRAFAASDDGGVATIDWLVILAGLTATGIVVVEVSTDTMTTHSANIQRELQGNTFETAWADSLPVGPSGAGMPDVTQVIYTEEEPGNGNGNNGHGNDADGNDDSNPGASNDPDDTTDDDGAPGGSDTATDTGTGSDADTDTDTRNGNNGHGNDADGNDDSNPGASNDADDTTDDDGTPGNSALAHADVPGNGNGRGNPFQMFWDWLSEVFGQV